MKSFVVYKSMTKKNQWELMSFTLSYHLRKASFVDTIDNKFMFTIEGLKHDKQISNKLIVFT